MMLVAGYLMLAKGIASLRLFIKFGSIPSTTGNQHPASSICMYLQHNTLKPYASVKILA